MFGSGRQIPLSAHRRLLDLLDGGGPVTVRLSSGEERAFSSGPEYLAEAHSDDLQGAEFIIPSETYPSDVVCDAFTTELARRTHMIMPNGDRVPYDRFMNQAQATVTRTYQSLPSASPYKPLFHKQPRQPTLPVLPAQPKQTGQTEHPAASLDGVPEDKLLVALGGSQRLDLKVYDAVLSSYESKKPVDVTLVTGKVVTVNTYEDLIGKQVDPLFMGAKVRLGSGVRVPIATYRAVVAAHKHRGVYVVGPEEQRVHYSEYVKSRAERDQLSEEDPSEVASEQDKVDKKKASEGNKYVKDCS